MMDFFLAQALALLLAIPMLGAFLTPVLGHYLETARNAWVVLISFLTLVTATTLAWVVYSTGTVVYTFGAVSPTLGIPADSGGIPIRILFEVDAMGAFMALSASIVGFAVVLYSLSSVRKLSGKDGYYALLLLLSVGIFGMVCTGDLFNFFVFLES